MSKRSPSLLMFFLIRFTDSTRTDFPFRHQSKIGSDATLTRLAVVIWIAGLLSQVGCTRALPDVDSPAPAIKDVGPPPTEAEAQEFADKMHQAIEARDPAAIEQLVRTEDLCERVLRDLGLSSSQIQDCRKGLATALQEASVGRKILRGIEGDGSYKLIRHRTVQGQPRPTFRLIGANGALNYHEYTLIRHHNGEVVASDLYVYLLAEPMSQVFRRLFIPTVKAIKGNGLLGKIDAQELSNVEIAGTMVKAKRSNDFKSAVAAYHTLPKKAQEQKYFLVMYMQATMNLDKDGEADYLAAMQKFRDLYPNDPAVDFISIDYFFLTSRFDDARKSIKRLDQAIGGDPYLHMLSGNAWMEEGRFVEARQTMEEAIKAEPDLEPIYWARITLSLREKNFTDTLKWLQTIVEKCQVAIGNLKEVPEYAEFVKSPQYSEWEKWYADHTKGNE